MMVKGPDGKLPKPKFKPKTKGPNRKNGDQIREMPKAPRDNGLKTIDIVQAFREKGNATSMSDWARSRAKAIGKGNDELPAKAEATELRYLYRLLKKVHGLKNAKFKPSE